MGEVNVPLLYKNGCSLHPPFPEFLSNSYLFITKLNIFCPEYQSNFESQMYELLINKQVGGQLHIKLYNLPEGGCGCQIVFNDRKLR